MRCAVGAEGAVRAAARLLAGCNDSNAPTVFQFFFPSRSQPDKSLQEETHVSV